MRIYAGVTDQDWFDFLRSQQDIDEVNSWQPAADAKRGTLRYGDYSIIKLHRNEQTGTRVDGPAFIAGSEVLASGIILS